jgi:AcrR family transcriptional regulator
MRKQRARGSITREAVINAALAVADRDGVDRLTIRSVAVLVAAPPMSLYTHFSNKEELLDLMYEEISHRMYTYEGHSTWQAELRALCYRVRGVLSAHPRWAVLLSRPTLPLAVPMRERILKAMIADGILATDALLGLSSAVLGSIGLVLVKTTLTEPDGQSTIDRRFERLKEWVEAQDAQETAETRAAFSQQPRFEIDHVFQFLVDALILGLEAKRA